MNSENNTEFQKLKRRNQVKFKVEVIPEKGRGLVATENIAKGELVESSPVLKLPLFKASDSALATQLDRYVYFWTSDKFALALGYGSLINHDDNPNLVFKPDLNNDKINYYASRDIPKDEEFTIDYGRCISIEEKQLAKEID